MEGLKSLYKNTYGNEPAKMVKLPGAGSNRAYYRIASAGGDTVIGVVGTSKEENNAFIVLTNHFCSKQLPVPRILAVSNDDLRYLQTDLGDISLFDIIKGKEGLGVGLLESVIRLLPRFQFEGAEGCDFSVCYPQPEFDRDNVMFDLNYFKYCFLKATGVDFHELRLQRDFDKLAEELTTVDASGKPCFMYRDFQSRNVMIKDGQPYFIDYQGGRRGPFYYDLASFLWQASAGYPDELKNRLINIYANEVHRRYGVTFSRPRLEKFVFFRTLQVLGAYGFRGYFERKQHFIDSISPAINNLQAMLEKGAADNYPELKSVLKKIALNPHPSPRLASLSNHTPHPSPLVVCVNSFSYKKGIPVDESGNGGGYVFDCRSIHNPGRYLEYKQLTGLDVPVIKFLEEDGEIIDFLQSVYKLADHHVQRYIERGFSHLMFSFGCTGGQHRSVYCAQHLAEYLKKKYEIRIILSHIEQKIHNEL
ncbi:MAG: RNase adapter RapZ [Prevotellaceae bacterium]|nr:RNase adapter RapZ [Prevotellaceae bacterium]